MPPGNSEQSVASLDRVSKLFGSVPALRTLTCELQSGRAYLVLGENGAGKSTLLRILAGLSQPTSGSMAIFGQQPGESIETIGYMGHETMLYDELTALENLRYYATLYGEQRCLRPEHALEMVGLISTDTRLTGDYSQGMKQRVSLARVLMIRPRLLLLDEPFSNMDRASALQMLEQLRTLRDGGCTIVLTTHQPELAVPLADETWHLRRGELATGVRS
jgi:heme ABC exporter ATP-binding subunit CcmA